MCVRGPAVDLLGTQAPVINDNFVFPGFSPRGPCSKSLTIRQWFSRASVAHGLILSFFILKKKFRKGNNERDRMTWLGRTPVRGRGGRKNQPNIDFPRSSPRTFWYRYFSSKVKFRESRWNAFNNRITMRNTSMFLSLYECEFRVPALNTDTLKCGMSGETHITHKHVFDVNRIKLKYDTRVLRLTRVRAQPHASISVTRVCIVSHVTA